MVTWFPFMTSHVDPCWSSFCGHLCTALQWWLRATQNFKHSPWESVCFAPLCLQACCWEAINFAAHALKCAEMWTSVALHLVWLFKCIVCFLWSMMWIKQWWRIGNVDARNSAIGLPLLFHTYVELPPVSELWRPGLSNARRHASLEYWQIQIYYGHQADPVSA